MKTSASQKMKAYRARLRQSGLRPVQIWVPDTNKDGFQERLHTQVANLNQQDERESLDFIESAADWSE
jgi:hypothetical protein